LALGSVGRGGTVRARPRRYPLQIERSEKSLCGTFGLGCTQQAACVVTQRTIGVTHAKKTTCDAMARSCARPSAKRGLAQ
jgi:hypothetical protein